MTLWSRIPDLARASIARWFWRRRRWAISQPARDAVGIERYSVFQGTLRISGTLDTPAPVRRLALHLPGGECLPVRFQPGSDRIRFDELLTVSAPADEVAEASLVASLEDGREVRQSGLGNAVGDPAHVLSGQFRSMLDAALPGRLLEVGARARSGVVRRDWVPAGWSYSGFDIAAGPNVDVVGDAHALSGYYAAEEFSAVMALSVLEHLLMPWKFVIELNRVMKPGAIGLFTTHQCWPIHDQPWDFWRFSDTAWTGLLNAATGFEIIAARMGEPAFLVAQRCSSTTAFPEGVAGALASFVMFRKIGPTGLEWPVDLGDILQTNYPGGETTA